MKSLAFPALCAGVTVLSLAAVPAPGQPSSTSPLAPPANGPRRADPTLVAITDATVHTKPGETLYHAAVVFQSGQIIGVLPGDPGPDAKPDTEDDVPARTPVGPRIVIGTGLHVYPAFIEPFLEVDANAPIAREGGTRGVQAHWSPNVTPQRSALDGGGISEGDANSLREIGFGAACIAPRGGVFRGSSAVVSLAKPAADASAARPPVYKEDAYQNVAFFTRSGAYPDSQMGAIALIRQTLSDADWQSGGRASSEFAGPKNALDVLANSKDDAESAAPSLLFQTEDELEFLRAAKIAREFSRPYMILGSGEEFARLDAIKKETQEPNYKGLVLPLNFPKAPDVSTPGKADSVELKDMMSWEQAPTNPRRLTAAGLAYSFSTAKLRRKGDFLGNVRKAILHGLPTDTALAALTTQPATLLGVGDQLGTIEAGKRANLLVTDGDVFAKKTKFRTVIVDGIAHELFTPPTNLEGEWDVTIPNAPAAKRWLSIDKDNGITVHLGDKETKAAKVSVEKMTVGFSFDHEAIAEKPKQGAEGAEKKEGDQKDAEKQVAEKSDAADKPAAPVPTPPPALQGHYLMSASIERGPDGSPARLVGQGVRANGERFTWSATRRPPSIAGEWPMFFEGGEMDGKRGGMIRVSDDSAVAPAGMKIEDVSTNDDGTITTKQAKQVTWDGKVLWYAVEMGANLPDLQITAKLDTTTNPPTLKGALANDLKDPEDRNPFVARRVDPKKWWVGHWRVCEFNGQRKPLDANDNVDIEMTEKGATVIYINQPFTHGPGTANKDRVSVKAEDFKVDGATITFKDSVKDLGMEGDTQETLTRVDGELRGVAKEPDGSEHTYVLRQVYEDKKDEDDDAAPTGIPEKLATPFGPFGLDALPPQQTFVLEHATIWTNTDKGVLNDATLVISNGKVQAVGAGSSLPADAVTIDCTGKHISPGVIDAHSHTGISKGVNEGAQAVTAEVRIQDVTNPDDVNWYRQLAGGVTSVLQLHGSANAIGGQSQTTKLRWGVAHPDDMHFEGAIPGIKFALGENPRSVNWDANTGQYPRTRMGVEMLIRDRFTAAREYAANPNHRRDLELEALAEILAGQRLVHCHSYRQDEMVMLATVADDFHFKLGTYTHALEGYKIADFVKTHAIGASGFTDWWAYKVEVQDAIPYAFPLMHKAGVVVSFNSDSNELARRLNAEAGKAVKYGDLVGGISQEEALKMVTLNPAKQLKIDNRVGTIEVGKDADLVVWSTIPLSSFARAERTFVDGREEFSLEKDKELRAKNAAERARLIQKLVAGDKKKKPDADEKKDEGGPPAGEGRRRRRPPNETDYAGSTSFLDEMTDQERAQVRQFYLDLQTSGKDPRFAPGVCGCGQLHTY